MVSFYGKNPPNTSYREEPRTPPINSISPIESLITAFVALLADRYAMLSIVAFLHLPGCLAMITGLEFCDLDVQPCRVAFDAFCHCDAIE